MREVPDGIRPAVRSCLMAATLKGTDEALGEVRTTLAILRAGGIANAVPALELAEAAHRCDSSEGRDEPARR